MPKQNPDQRRLIQQLKAELERARNRLRLSASVADVRECKRLYAQIQVLEGS